MDRAKIERLNDMGLKLAWSPAREGMDWIAQGIWFILVVDPDGGYWTVAPERMVGSDGKRDRPEGCLLDEEKPAELAEVLREMGCSDVRLFRLEEKARLSGTPAQGSP